MYLFYYPVLLPSGLFGFQWNLDWFVVKFQQTIYYFIVKIPTAYLKCLWNLGNRNIAKVHSSFGVVLCSIYGVSPNGLKLQKSYVFGTVWFVCLSVCQFYTMWSKVRWNNENTNSSKNIYRAILHSINYLNYGKLTNIWSKNYKNEVQDTIFIYFVDNFESIGLSFSINKLE